MTDTKTKTVAEELREAARHIRENARGTAAGPWKASPVWSPDSASTSAVYSYAYPTGTVESEVVASGQKRYRKGGLRNPCNARWIALMNPDLAEPLASWLEKTAEGVAKAVYEDEICDIPGGSKDHCEADCRGHDPVLVCDECGNLLAPTSPRQGPACSCWTTALAVARVLNGTAS